MDFCDHLLKNLEILLNNGKIGSFKFQPTDIQSKPNKFLETTRGFKNYHFCINIPYAGKRLNWEVIFNPEDFSELPDFDFNDYFFLSEPDINYIAENVPSWDKWDLSNHYSMLNILNEFLTLFKKSQVEKLFKQNKLFKIKDQYEELLKVKNISEDQIEILVENRQEVDVSNDDTTLVSFLIFLPIDFSQLPEYYQEDCEELLNPGEDFSCLNIQMKKLDNSQTKVLLSLSPRADQLLNNFRLPKYRKDTELADYVTMVNNLIEDHVKYIIYQHDMRNVFIMAVVEAFSSGIVEYDATRFQKVTFIYEDFEDYDCLVSVILGANFPEDKPKIQMHSLFCQSGRTCNHTLAFPYHFETPIAQTIKNLRDTLHTEAKNLQNHKH